MEGNSIYSNEEKLRIARILVDKGCTIENIKKIVPQIEQDYQPTKEQSGKMLGIISGRYTYINDYIDNKLLKTVKKEDLGEVKNKKLWKKDGAALKRYIYENELVKDLLEEIGCGKIKYHPDKAYWSCTNPDGDNISAVNVKDNPYLGVKNYTREDDFDDKADIITLVEYSRNCDYIKAYDYICDVLGINADLLPKTKVKQERTKKNDLDARTEEKKLTVLDEKILNRYEPILYIGWFREGIMPWTRNKYDIRYNYEGKRVVVPIRHWETGELVATNQRTTVEDYELLGIEKYRITSGYQKSLNIYGLYENKKDILENGYVVVYESEKSVLKRDSLNDPTGVALGGKFLSDKQAEILLSLNVDIVISMDADVPLEEILWMCEKLYQKNGKNVYYTVDYHGLMGEKDSVADLKMKDYDLIFCEKVLYDEKEHEKLMKWLNKT